MPAYPLPPRREESPLELAVTVFISFLGFLAALVFVPCFLPVSLIFRIYRHTLHRKIREETHGDVIIASGDDAVWFQDSPKNTAVINSIIFVKGEVDIEKLRKTCLERIIHATDDEGNLIAPKFSCHPSRLFRRYIWVKDECFDISHHVFVHDGPVPNSQEELERLIGDLCSGPLPPRVSPWQMIVIPSPVRPPAAEGNTTLDKEQEPTFQIIFRVHHAIGDGVSLMRLLMQNVMDLSPDVTQLPRKFASKGLAMRIFKAIFTGPAMVLGRIFWPADHHALHGPELTGDKLFVWSSTMDLKLVKRMKDATGTTVNDILMTCLAGGFHEYFKRHTSRTPDDILTYVPVDIRSPHAKLVVDNQFALVFLKLPIGIADRMLRLTETRERMSLIKNSAEPLVNALMIRYLMARFPNWLTQMLFDNIASKCSLVLSNVPGPQQPCHLAGWKLEQMIFWPPQRVNVGMGISILSYNGTVKTGVMIDKRLCTNPRLLVNEFEKEFFAMAKQLNVLDDSHE